MSSLLSPGEGDNGISISPRLVLGDDRAVAQSPPIGTVTECENRAAGFVDGVLSLSATGGNGVLIKDDAGAPAARGGAGFSHFFGLNDLFKAQSPSLLSTGLVATDPSGVASGGVSPHT